MLREKVYKETENLWTIRKIRTLRTCQKELLGQRARWSMLETCFGRSGEHRLRQMRPTHLPPPSGGSGGQTADEHPESVGTDAMFSAALEMDRQTSVGRYRPLDALTFLAEAGNMVRSGPEYYHMAAGEDDHAGGFVGQANDERATSVASRTGPLGIRSNSDHERDGQRAGPQGSAKEDSGEERPLEV